MSQTDIDKISFRLWNFKQISLLNSKSIMILIHFVVTESTFPQMRNVIEGAFASLNPSRNWYHGLSHIISVMEFQLVQPTLWNAWYCKQDYNIKDNAL